MEEREGRVLDAAYCCVFFLAFFCFCFLLLVRCGFYACTLICWPELGMRSTGKRQRRHPAFPLTTPRRLALPDPWLSSRSASIHRRRRSMSSMACAACQESLSPRLSVRSIAVAWPCFRSGNQAFPLRQKCRKIISNLLQSSRALAGVGGAQAR